MYLNKVGIVGNYYGVAYLHELITELFQVALSEGLHKMYDEKLSAVAELYVIYVFQRKVVVLWGDSFLLLCHIIVYGISVHHHLKAAVYGHKTLAAAVHHARFLEHRQQLRRLPQGFLAAFYHYVDKAEHVCALIELALYRSAYHARNGKYGSFLGLHHRLVGGLGTHAQRVGQQLRVHLLTALQRLCKAAEYL